MKNILHNTEFQTVFCLGLEDWKLVFQAEPEVYFSKPENEVT